MTVAAPAVEVTGLGKRYDIFERPADRLKQPLINNLRRLAGRPSINYGREHWALRDVSFSIAMGETVGIIGRNGSGKSTLLQMICGILSPSQGSVQVRGRVAALLELGAGFNPEFTGRENVYMNGAILGMRREAIDARYEDIVAFADIGRFVDQPVSTYSSGMYVRLAFAVIANVDADILVIDEALAVGDVFFTQKCMRFLRRFQEKGTVLFVSHDSGAVVNLCSRAVWLEQGSVREVGSAQRVCEHYLAGRYVGASASRESPLDQVVPEGPEEADARSTATSTETSTVTSTAASTAASTGSKAPTAVGRKAEVAKALPPRDMRSDFIDTTRLRNDIEVFSFGTAERHFGSGGAEVLATGLYDDQGRALSWVVGGEEVQVRVQVRFAIQVVQIIVGFFFKDRLGQVLFGDNSWLSHCERPISAAPGDRVEARFPFRMPILPRGAYSVDVAVADGTHDEHVQLQWVHDAFAVESHASSASTGLIGIPMGTIELVRQER